MPTASQSREGLASAPRARNKKEELGLLSYFRFSRASLTLLWLLSGQGQTVQPVLEPPRSMALDVTWKDSQLLFSSPRRRANMPRVPPAPEGAAKGPRLGPCDDARRRGPPVGAFAPRRALPRHPAPPAPSLGLPSSLASAIRKVSTEPLLPASACSGKADSLSPQPRKQKPTQEDSEVISRTKLRRALLCMFWLLSLVQ